MTTAQSIASEVRRRIVEKAYSRQIDEIYTPGTSARAASYPAT